MVREASRPHRKRPALTALGESPPVHPGRNSNDVLDDLKRLQIALSAISADLDTIERRPHYALRFAAQNLTRESSHGIEDVVSKFAVAIKRTSLRD
jgi:hypothetical protein